MSDLAYLDHAATSPIRPEVVDAMMPYFGERFGNPSSSHRFGRAAKAGLEGARRQVADALGVEPGQVIFTSGGTEADNLALIGGALAAKAAGRPMTVVTTTTEHKAVLAAASAVARMGGESVLLPVDGVGQLHRAAFEEALGRSPAVVSVMWVNNETGALQPIAELAAACRDAGVRFHTDAVQALGKVPVSAAAIPGALISISGHKVGAPKGIGALIVPDRGAVAALVHGGGQQFGVRPGTEHVAGAVALGEATRLAVAEQESHAAKLEALRQRLLDGLRRALPDLVVHADAGPRAPHIANLSAPGAESEALLMHLDLAGVAASGGSACSTGAVEPSHVLTAMGVPDALGRAAVRFSLGPTSTDAEVDRAVAAYPTAVARVRELGMALGRV
ncbi:MAG: cysteine desulfurase family protein [Gemmatimonadales bacterium]